MSYNFDCRAIHHCDPSHTMFFDHSNHSGIVTALLYHRQSAHRRHGIFDYGMFVVALAKSLAVAA